MAFDDCWSLAGYNKGILQPPLFVKRYWPLQSSIYRPPSAMKWPLTSIQKLIAKLCKAGRWTLYDSTHRPPSSFFPSCISPMIYGHLLLPMVARLARRNGYTPINGSFKTTSTPPRSPLVMAPQRL